ncbi:MAG: membrane protein insertion efficiency factor YidD [Nitrospirota bacterium]
MKILAVFVINSYKKYISPFLPHSCRFHPSCSSYCLEAINNYGSLKGSGLFLMRILKCHPFHPGGYDPVAFHKNDNA